MSGDADLSGAGTGSDSGADAADLVHADATELAARIRRREVSAREVVRAHLDRIDEVNPRVNAVVSLDPEGAMAAAAAADERLARGAEVGALHGLPIAFKDTHLTRGMRTTRGSPLYAETVPDEDELLVQRIQAAGAIRIGKTNVPEFAAGSHTFNPVFGVTRNPYDLGRSAGGSSGGAAAALAAGMQPIADGSDMGGSLRNPASFCNVVGLRPTPGRVPSYPAWNPWDTLTVPGPMARTVADAALLLSVMAGPDPRCPVSLEAPGAAFRELPARELTGLRVAWTPDLGGRVPVDAGVRAVLEPQLEVFRQLGCRVEEDCPDLDDAEGVFRTLRAHHFDMALGAVLDESRDDLKPSLVWNIEEGRRLTGADLVRATAGRARLHLGAVDFFTRYDVLLAPVSQVVPFEAGLEYPAVVDGQPQRTYIDWMRSAYFVSVLGAPALSVPAGFTPDGLPVGLQIVGPPRADLAVLQVGAAYEAATRYGRRRPPR
ncbi:MULTISPECIES: amidase [Streptomyces]|uniref:Amidase n=2 Tax=Streptomyces rimosus subsp. rimosus TaxID=132474 RepID=L8EMP5_STRR1|nr:MULTISPECIES: amidase [Streptomyces]MYT44591.1 amidase [Streptomyces sp. SID5471]KEF09442.1 amidase [Streptomyces rimosus]KEF18466.1 amidase [Streptomyces rimosus]KOT31914.1 amidase [Streptomyces rimosus subsp. rimosus]KOT32924.1 amidase [Streptomyces sp. NRRL WC-3701]